MIKKLLLSLFWVAILPTTNAQLQILNKDEVLQSYPYWHNKDFDWYKKNIPFLETPDKDINRTYYYRWDNLTLHLVYGSPESGYAVTEFIDRPWWSGKFGAISCSAGHHFYDLRWLRDSRYWEEYARYWYKNAGAQPRNYSTWIADGIWNAYKVNLDKALVLSLKDSMISNYNQWEKEHYIESEGMFAWSGMHDGMETNINSRQTPQWFEGASGYRPTLNSYMWADANAVANIARMDGDNNNALLFDRKAATIKQNFQQKCWDSIRQFFYHRFEKDEVGGIKANTLTYQTGKYAGNPHGREEIGFIPWYFNMPDKGYESAWKFLMDPNYFYAPFGPTTVEKNDPLYHVTPNCCAWSGNSWPFATSQTIKAMSNLLRNYNQSVVSREDYIRLLEHYAASQVKNDTPFIGEANNPETGSWSGHDYIGHSEHYFHSSYIDLIVDGLMGIEASATDSLIVNPLIPADWNYACLENVRYHGHDVSIVWDKDGSRYRKGKGLLVFVDNKLADSSRQIQKLSILLKEKKQENKSLQWNYAVNNEPENYYPHVSTLFPGIGKSLPAKMNDGQYWYLSTTPNQWSSKFSDDEKQSVEIDFGTSRPVNTIKLYFVRDSVAGIELPQKYDLQYFVNGTWKKVPGEKRQYEVPYANRANAVNFPTINSTKFRILFTGNSPLAISEVEAWGPSQKDYQIPPNPTTIITNIGFMDNAAVSSSFVSKVDDITNIHDGSLNPDARWTAWKSPNESDWIQFDFKKNQEISKVYLYIFADNSEIAPPVSYQLQYWNGQAWALVENTSKLPTTPIADLNICTFKPVKTEKLRITLSHKVPGHIYSGLYEVEIW